MRSIPVELVALLVVAPIACASTSEQRRDYILAHPHGWVEITIEDRAVPQVPASEDRPAELVRPESCSVEVRLDREPFVHGSVYPAGDAAPYSVVTGFRFPAPIGATRMLVSYSGCDIESGNTSSVATEADIAVEIDRVTEIRFDGASLTALPTRDDSVVTLEDVYEAVTGKAKQAQ